MGMHSIHDLVKENEAKNAMQWPEKQQHHHHHQQHQPITAKKCIHHWIQVGKSDQFTQEKWMAPICIILIAQSGEM